MKTAFSITIFVVTFMATYSTGKLILNHGKTQEALDLAVRGVNLAEEALRQRDSLQVIVDSLQTQP